MTVQSTAWTLTYPNVLYVLLHANQTICYLYKLANIALDRVSTVRGLGVIINSKLIFDTHIDNIFEEATKSLTFVLMILGDIKNITFSKDIFKVRSIYIDRIFTYKNLYFL